MGDTEEKRVLPGVPTTKCRTSDALLDSALTILELVQEPVRACPIASSHVVMRMSRIASEARMELQ